MKKKTIVLIMLLLAIFTLTACNSNKDEAKDTNSKTREDLYDADKTSDHNDNQKEEQEEEDNMENFKFEATDKVEIEVEGYGKILVELDRNIAPITVENFVKLAEEGFYDGLTFHRIITGFMIQGGDPNGNGTGGSDQDIKGEFAINGVDNPISHTRGAISMARSRANDSASSQFFIVHEDSTFLDGQYAAFGYVVEGIEIVDQICDATAVEDSNGTVLRQNQPIIKSIKVIK